MLNGEVFYTLNEAQIIIEQWRKHYNTKRPHSALGYRPPSPETIIPMERRLDVAEKGYATEAMLAAQGWMDGQSFGNRTVCKIASGRAASIRVAEKCGYSFLREAQDEDGCIILMTREKPAAT